MRRSTVLVSLVSLLALAPLATQAQCLVHPPNSAGVFADEEGNSIAGTLLPNVPTRVYVLAFDMEGDMFGYEFHLDADPALFFLSTVLPLAPEYWQGLNNDYLVGTGSCAPGEGTLILLAAQVLGFEFKPDMLFCISAPVTSPTAACNGLPCWLKCDETVQPLETAGIPPGWNYPPGCAIYNPTQEVCPVSTEERSWGFLKASYD